MSEFVIGRRQLFILPTRIGWYFSVILLALFAIAVKFDNQAAFMMLFLLVAIGIISMHYTHNNVIDLELNTGVAKPVFLGKNAQFPIKILNTSKQSRQAIWIMCAGYKQVFKVDTNDAFETLITLPTIKRGYLECPEITLSSQFPLGLFFCWSRRFQSTQRCIVYPHPLDLVPYPESGDNSSEAHSKLSVKNNQADYSGMKAYQPGDRPRDIHWPSLAKTHKLITVQHEDQSSSSINLSWYSLPRHLSVEDRLSQLCYWVIKAEKNDIRYKLEMPNHTIEHDSGTQHLQECLRILALWGEN